MAAAHAHSVYGKAFSSLGRLLDPITQDACAFFEDHVLCSAYGGRIVLEAHAGEALAKELGDHKAVIHQSHGLFTVGQSVEEAAWWFVTMERSAQAQLLAEAVGTPRLIPDEDARYTREQIGTPLGWLVLVLPALGRDRPVRSRPLRLRDRRQAEPRGSSAATGAVGSRDALPV